MIVDSSAVVAVLLDEPDAAVFRRALVDQPARMAAPSVVECAAVLGPWRQELLDELLEVAAVEVVAFGAEHARAARAAYARFGRGSGSPARLNLGDCFSYALAVVADEPLLWKGEDFSHTDVRPALDGFEQS